ncbi:DMT family transporter [Legionella bozemanae]|uniref:DMT family transporter n=1 Tax=Legionella bozemanae TaxID=447 RepID=UPI003EEE4E7F
MYLRILSPTFAALAAAVFFGGSTPFAKELVGQISPLLLAGLLYLGSGIRLIVTRLIKDRGWHHSGLVKDDWIWLFGAIGFGGILGPILLMFGLQQTSATTTSLLLNLEAVLTALLAWIIFKENTSHRIVLSMFLIVAGGTLLSWPQGKAAELNLFGPLAIAGACLCWAIDNNLTRKVSVGDPFFIAGSKGLISGIVKYKHCSLLWIDFSYLVNNRLCIIGWIYWLWCKPSFVCSGFTRFRNSQNRCLFFNCTFYWCCHCDFIFS